MDDQAAELHRLDSSLQATGKRLAVGMGRYTLAVDICILYIPNSISHVQSGNEE